MSGEAWATAVGVLRLANQLVDGIQAGVTRRGFTDVRPAHGFAFAALAGGGATTSELAEHLGMTKQSASQLVDYLVERGYVERAAHPTDARARLLVLTDRGWGCTRAAEAAAAETVEQWRSRIGAAEFDALQGAVAALALPGRLRPTW